MKTTLNVKVEVDDHGNASIAFDRAKLLRMPLHEVMREVAAIGAEVEYERGWRAGAARAKEVMVAMAMRSIGGATFTVNDIEAALGAIAGPPDKGYAP